MGMIVSVALLGVVLYVTRQWSKVRLKSLEVRALELEKGADVNRTGRASS